MAQPKCVPLITRVEQAHFEHAVLTTYGMDIPFFEAAVMRHLLRNGCRNSVVFADGQHLGVELARLSEPGNARTYWYGKLYSLVPVHHSAAFHPKIAFLVGDDVEVYVGSGNLEPGGLANNSEIFHRVRCTKENPPDEDAEIVRGIWRFVRQTVASLVPDIVHRQLLRVAEDVPWLNQQPTPSPHVVLGPGKNVTSILASVIGKDPVKTLYAVSPFFDANLKALTSLVKALQPKHTTLLLQPDTVSFPGKELKQLKNVDVFEIKKRGYLHAKVVVIECKAKSVLMAGSHNVSAPAFDGDNFEASIIRISGIEARYSEILGLAENANEKNRIPFNGVSLNIRADIAPPGAGRGAWIASAQFYAGRVDVLTRKLLGRDCRLVVFGEPGISKVLSVVPECTSNKLSFVLYDDEAKGWPAVAITANGKQSQPVPLLHVDPLENQARTPRERDIGERLGRLCHDIGELAGLLNSVSSLLMPSAGVPSKQAPDRKIDANPSTPTTGIRQMRYEDFVVPWSTSAGQEDLHSVDRSNLEIVIAAISRAIDGKTTGIDEIDSVQDSSLLNAESSLESLANTSVYDEEVMADGRLEVDVQSARQLGYRQNDDTAVRSLIKDASQAGEKLKSLQRSHSRLSKFSNVFPKYFRQVAQECRVSIDIFERLAAAGSFLTQFVGRKLSAGKQTIELFDWEGWGQFNVEIFDALSSSELCTLSKIDWADAQSQLNRPAVERFLGYVAVLEAFCRTEFVKPEAAARIRVGLLRICRILRVDRQGVSTKMVTKAADAVLGTIDANVRRPRLDWSSWTRTIERVGTLDEKFRRKYLSGADIVRDKSTASPEIGPMDWVWWPHADGHIGVVLSAADGHLEIAYEPLRTKLISRPYVVRVSDVLGSWNGRPAPTDTITVQP